MPRLSTARSRHAAKLLTVTCCLFSAAWGWGQDPAKWRPLGPSRFLPGTIPDNSINILGRINVLGFHPTDPRTVYAGSPAGGLWRTTDGGETWQQPYERQDRRVLAISGIAIDPKTPETIFVLNGDGNGGVLGHPARPTSGVLKSADGGRTWDAAGLSWKAANCHPRLRKQNPDCRWGFKLAMDPCDACVLFAVTNKGLVRTTDCAKTWESVHDGDFRDLEFQPAAECREKTRTIYASTTTAIYRSEKRGESETWEQVLELPGEIEESRIELAVTPIASDLVYAVAGAEAGGLLGVYRSRDAGRSFELRSNAPNILGWSEQASDDSAMPFYALGIAASPIDTEDLHVGGVSTWRSRDGGRTWCVTSNWRRLSHVPYTHADVHALELRREGDQQWSLYVANDGGVFRAENAHQPPAGAGPFCGLDWQDLSQGLNVTQAFHLCGSPRNRDLVWLARPRDTTACTSARISASITSSASPVTVRGKPSWIPLCSFWTWKSFTTAKTPRRHASGLRRSRRGCGKRLFISIAWRVPDEIRRS